MLAALQPKKGKFLLVFDVTQTTVHNTKGGQTSTTSKEDAHAALLDLGYRESGNPQYCGILVDNDAGTAGIRLVEGDRAKSYAARDFFTSTKGLFPHATAVELTAVFEVMLEL